MDPQAHQKAEDIENDFVTEDEDGLIQGHSREELEHLLQEAENGGMSEEPWEDFIRRLNLKYFGKETLG